MPYRDDPHLAVVHAIKEPVRRDDHLAVRQVRILGNDTTGFWESTQPAQVEFGLLPEVPRGQWVVTSDVLQRCEKLPAPQTA